MMETGQMTKRITAVVLLMLGFHWASAGAQIAMRLPQVVEQADLGFYGVVKGIREEFVPEKRMAFTHITFDVHELLFNRSSLSILDEVTLTFGGGRAGEAFVRFAGVPTFALGERIIALARHDGRRYANPLIGGVQGMFRVVWDEVTGRSYPLTAGSRGIERFVEGDSVTTDRIANVQGGRIVYEARRGLPGLARVEAPRPVAGSGRNMSARVSGLIAPRRPLTVADLRELLDEIRYQATHKACRR